jgi:outer membrane protein TolC
MAVMDHDMAVLDLEISRDRLSVEIRGNAISRYDAADHRGEYWHLATVQGEGLQGIVEDGAGRTLSVYARGRAALTPKTDPFGHEAGLGVEYAVPLWRNAAGALYDLETAYVAKSAQARAQEEAAVAMERCAVGIHLFLAVYFHQEKLRLWNELLEQRKAVYEQTRSDFRRRMIGELDFLAADSDWTTAEQHSVVLESEYRLAKVSLLLHASLPVQRDIILTAPEAVLSAVVVPEATKWLAKTELHPAVVRFAETADAFEGESLFLERSRLPEIRLISQAGIDFDSEVYFGATQPAHLTDLFVGLGLGLSWPLIDSAADYRRLKLMNRARHAREKRRDVVRHLLEQARRAERILAEVSQRIALEDKKLNTVRRQIQAAARRFANGQLEFQDYIQHRTVYENGRMARMELSYRGWRAKLDLLSALGTLPPPCDGEHQ